MMEQYLMKYVWAGCGQVMIAIPALLATRKNTISERTETFVGSRCVVQRPGGTGWPHVLV